MNNEYNEHKSNDSTRKPVYEGLRNDTNYYKQESLKHILKTYHKKTLDTQQYQTNIISAKFA